MNPIYSHLYLDLQHKTIDSVNLKQYDYESRYILCHITDNGNPYHLLLGTQAEIKIHKPDDTKIVNFANVDYDSNHITVEITSQMTAMYGILHADITLFQEGMVISTMPFLLNIERSPVQNEDVISSNEYGALEDLITEIQSNENQRQVNEESRKAAENVRNINEEIRKDNENIRVENENIRKEAEANREDNENIRIENEKNRITNEGIRQKQETDREEKTSVIIKDAQNATQATIKATNDLQDKLDNHHFVLTEDKDVANGVPSLDTDRKIPINELYDATTMSKGVVQLTDSVDSTSVTTAATPNSVKIVYDALTTEKNRLSNVENKSSATIRSEITKSNVTNALGYTPYTPNEIDNKISLLETNIDWKESVNTFSDIAITYPTPQDGWTVNVKDTDYTYRYNGTEWIAISANAIPKATNSVDGLLSKEDHTKYEDADSKKHTHNNKSVLDNITDDIINKINNISSHNHDDRYYTESEVNNLLSTKAASNHTHNYAASSHTHDDRYYTESEINTLLSGKAASGHAHDDRYYTEGEVNNLLAAKAASNHSHGNMGTWEWKENGQPAWLWSSNEPGAGFLTAPSKLSVGYANNAGSANAVDWNNVTNKPSMRQWSEFKDNVTLGQGSNIVSAPIAEATGWFFVSATARIRDTLSATDNVGIYLSVSDSVQYLEWWESANSVSAPNACHMLQATAIFHINVGQRINLNMFSTTACMIQGIRFKWTLLAPD